MFDVDTFGETVDALAEGCDETACVPARVTDVRLEDCTATPAGACTADTAATGAVYEPSRLARTGSPATAVATSRALGADDGRAGRYGSTGREFFGLGVVGDRFGFSRGTGVVGTAMRVTVDGLAATVTRSTRCACGANPPLRMS